MIDRNALLRVWPWLLLAAIAVACIVGFIVTKSTEGPLPWKGN